MRKSVSMSAGCLVAAVFTHGFVSTGENLAPYVLQLPFFTYHGFFSHLILGLWWLWTLAHGEPSTSLLNGSEHGVETFGRVLAFAVLFALPLIGFAISALSSSQRMCWKWLRPLAIAMILAFWDVLVPAHVDALRHVTLRQLFLGAGLSEEFAEATRAVVVTLIMLWSAGGIRFRRSSGAEPTPGIVTI